MTVVLDASVVISALVDSTPEGRWAASLMETESLACPHIVMPEVANVLRRLEVAGIISASNATEGLNTLTRLNVELYPFIPFARQIWSLRHNMTCYDAFYVAVAEFLDCPLATFDGRLARAAQSRCKLIFPPALPDNNL